VRQDSSGDWEWVVAGTGRCLEAEPRGPPSNSGYDSPCTSLAAPIASRAKSESSSALSCLCWLSAQAWYCSLRRRSTATFACSR